MLKKIMIASDIHGSAYYCRQLLERFQEEKADKLVLLGDICIMDHVMICLRNMHLRK